MTTPDGIAAVTQTLVSLLEAALQAENSSYRVSTLPLDKSNEDTQPPNRLNLFLFQVQHNAAWRNTPLPDRSLGGEPARPPLAVNLSYFLTAYGDVAAEPTEHRILGLAMQYLHDHPLLMRQDIANAFPNTGLEDQIERVRITPRSLSLEELLRAWGAFMTQYRVSAAYDVSVVLIDSAVSNPPGLPVLRRGDADRGAAAEAGLPPFLSRVLPPAMLRRGTQVIYQPAVRLGESLTLEGDRLPQDNVLLQIRSPTWEPRWAGLVLQASTGTGTLQAVMVDPPPEPDGPGGAPLAWSPGVYTAALLLRVPGTPDVVSNAVPFALAPRVTVDPTNAAPGNLNLTVTCLPPPGPHQHTVALLSGRTPIAPAAVTPPGGAGEPASLHFTVPGLTAGSYVARLRVDGVDSLPYGVVLVPGSPAQLEFDPAQTVVVA